MITGEQIRRNYNSKDLVNFLKKTNLRVITEHGVLEVIDSKLIKVYHWYEVRVAVKKKRKTWYDFRSFRDNNFLLEDEPYDDAAPKDFLDQPYEIGQFVFTSSGTVSIFGTVEEICSDGTIKLKVFRESGDGERINNRKGNVDFHMRKPIRGVIVNKEAYFQEILKIL